ncbi:MULTISPECIES: non-ribosomal peptide synthetase [Paenibacillus]|uniref:non-ribosomal peptide synthetase n=1 Tax=Paenibacillus TaxID=44249 RepID=UPI0022B91EDF|nr:non-ribosomal peptide synthetase [Paenibacillus caseinilyticus]MCZ8518257.1 amino acid adenylation domain-containing protein [Paenibacillus caseinilyticus]
MKSVSTLPQLLAERRHLAAGITFAEPKRERYLSYDELFMQAQERLGAMQEIGVGAKDHVVFQLEDNESFIVSFWACLLGGIIPVPVMAGHTEEIRLKVTQICAILESPYLLCTEEFGQAYLTYCRDQGDVDTMEKMQGRVLPIEQLRSSDHKAGLGQLHEAQGCDTAFIQFSSGSTGDPKGVVLTHDNLICNMRAIVSGSHATELDSSLSWLPLTHDMGLIGFHLTPMYAGFHQWQMPSSMFVMNPMMWLQLASRHKITCLSSPNFGYAHVLKHFKPEQAEGLDLSCVRLIFNGAEPISEQISRAFTELLEPYGLQEKSIFPVYGLAEASLAVTFSPADEPLQALRLDRNHLKLGHKIKMAQDTGTGSSDEAISVVDLGYPVEDCEIKLCDPNGEEVQSEHIGLIHIRGGNVTRGYYQQPEANASLISGEGWLNTGDLGFVRNGRLFVTGRMKDIIFVNGQNVYPHDLEYIASRVKGAELGKAAVCAVQDPVRKQDEIALFVQFRSKKLELFLPMKRELQQLLNRHTGLNVNLIVPVKHIFKTTSGKIQRYAFAERMNNGEYAETIALLERLERDSAESGDRDQAAAAMEPLTADEQRILDIWRKTLGSEKLGVDDHFLEKGGDSLKAAYAAAEIQTSFGLTLTPSELFRYPTARELAVRLRQLQEQASAAVGAEAIKPVPESEYYPASSAQKRLYILQQMNPELLNYHLPQAMDIQGALDFGLFARVWHTLMERHEALRTKFEMIDGQWMQRILPEVPLPISYLDAAGWAEETLDSHMAAFIRPFPHLEAPLFRIELLRTGEFRHRMLFDMHHLITDGTSMGILMKEFIALYENKELRALPVQFKDIVVWQENRKHDASMQKQRDYWRDVFKQGIPKLELTADFARPLHPSYRGGLHRFTIDRELTAELQRLAQQTGVTLYALLLTGYCTLLGRYSGQREFVIGTAVSGRTRVEMAPVAGMFVNTLPLRLSLDTEAAFLAALRSVHTQVLEAVDHQEVPYEEILELASAAWDPGRSPLFDTMFTLQNMELPQLQTAELLFTPVPITTGTSKVDLTWECYSTDGGIEVSLEYALDLFTPETAKQLARHYVHLLQQAAAHSHQVLTGLELMERHEVHQLLHTYNETASSYPKHLTLHELFELQAAANPQAVALVKDGHSLTYGELNKQANQWAHWLIDHGAASKAPVAIVLDRSFEMITALLAVLKAGCAYVPIDPNYPSERIQYILEDAGASTVLTQSAYFESCSDILQYLAADIRLVQVQELRAREADLPEYAPQAAAVSSDMAYIMYTSGSTGRPKGIQTTHYNVARVVKNVNYIHITPDDTLLQLSNYAFDGSTFDIYGALLNGARLVLLSADDVIHTARLLEVIQENKISLFFATTALFNAMVDENVEGLAGVRHMLFGGERASVTHIRKALQALGPNRLIHVYGPTESTVFATFYPIDALSDGQATIPIGKPISNTEVYVLDADARLVPRGVPGELYISGDGLARGYLNLPEQSEAAFIAHPFQEERRLYKTGDLVRWLGDGNLEFMDRIDTQVKIRGFRIELGEIEHKLAACPGIEEAVVAAVARGGEQILCAYVVAAHPISTEELRYELKRQLPAFMVPASIIQLDKLPLTPNGKIDKSALPEPQRIHAGDREPLATETELRLGEIWKQVLQVGDVGRYDNFFEAGGHSLKAAAIVSQVGKQFHVKMPIALVFEQPELYRQAEWIEQSTTGRTFEAIQPAPYQEQYPLTPAQHKMFILEQFAEVGVAYQIPLALRIEGKLERESVEGAFRQLIARHEPLRTSFHRSGSEVWQNVWTQVPFHVAETTFNEGELEAAFAAFTQPFDVTQAPLIRVQYATERRGPSYLFVSVHHIVSDGISIKELLEEFMMLMQGKELEPLPLQYKDYAVWLRGQESSDWMRANDAYWQEQLAGAIPVLDMPADYPRGDRRTFAGETLSFAIPADLSGRLHGFAEQRGLTLNSVLFAAYSLLLYLYTDQQEMVIGSLSAGRTHPDVERMGGMFNQFLPVFIKVDEELAFTEHVRLVQHRLLQAYEHQDTSSTAWMDTALPVDGSRNPLFDTMLILHNQMDADVRLHGEDCSLTPEVLHTKTAKLDFKLDIYQSGSGQLNAALEYNTKLFRSESMERLAGHFLHVLEQITEHPQSDCAAFSLISEDETELILHTFNDTRYPHPTSLTLHVYFEKQAAMTPDRQAVASSEGSLTYRQLNEKANRLARILRESGVQRDTVVPIVAERSLSMMVGIMAILKAGGAYLPIDPTLPEERISYLLADSRAAVIAVQSKWKALLGQAYTLIDLDDESAYSHMGPDNLPAGSGPDDLAYVIYTSGSTGNPKGVMVEHRAIVNRLLWMQRKYPLTGEDVILQKTPISFDVSVWELFWWGMVGASVYLLEPGGEKEPQRMLRAIREHRISVMHFVPSMLHVFMEYARQPQQTADLSGLHYVFTSGEALKPHQVQQFAALCAGHSSAKLVNLYGPTEAAVDVSYYDCGPDAGAAVPIGRPIDNLQLYVVNSMHQLQPIGVHGELCISGAGLARGYWQREELTNEKFVPNPFVPGEKMYLTGDRASWLPDGNLVYWGRMDTQVKIRGIRIECGEVEQALLKHEAIREAVVAAVPDGLGEQVLCAYVAVDSPIDEEEVKLSLHRSLPQYMVPAVIVTLARIPLSSNGKVDRRSLPKPQLDKRENGTAPRTETEKRLAGLWQEVLGDQQLAIDSNFFVMGGHSLRAAQLSGRIEQHFHVQFTLQDVFQAPVLEQMAKLVEGAASQLWQPLPRAGQQEVYPLSLAQNRLFILHHVDAGQTVYNLPFAMRIEGALDVQRLHAALQSLVDRHEPLRTSFEWHDGVPAQRIRDEVPLNLERRQADEDELPALVQAFIRPFDLTAAPLLRAALVQTGEHKHVLLLDMHHIVSDGVSTVVLAQEFVKLYQGESLTPLAAQYKDAAVWQQGWLESGEREKQEQFWRETLAGELPLLNLPADMPRPAWQSFEGDSIREMFPRELAERVNQLAQACEVTPYMLLFSVFHVLLYKLTGQNDLIVGTPVSGRFHPDTEPLVGMFVNTLPIRSNPDGNWQFRRFMEDMKQRMLQAFAHDQLPFEQCVTLLDVPRDTSRNPIFDVLFVMQNMGIPQVDAEALSFTPYAVEHPVSKLDMTFELVPHEDGIHVRVEYATRLYAPESIKRMMNQYRYLLESVAADPEVTLSGLRLQSQQEEQAMLMTLNPQPVAYADRMTIESYLEERARQEPKRIAAVFRDQALSYEELNAKANQLAHVLRSAGIGSEDLIAVRMDRSLEMLVSLYAVLKAGAGYVPIAVQMPAERVEFVLKDSLAKLLLVQSPADEETLTFDIPTIDIDQLDWSSQPADDLPKLHHSKNIAYVIYTSGSTGQPKGVMVEHHSVINRIGWMQKQYPLQPHDIILQKTPFTFDVSVWELFWWSFAGAGVCLLEPEGEKNPQLILDTLAEKKITTMHFVPSMLHVFLDYVANKNAGEPEHLLTHVFASGEALTPDMVSRFRGIFSRSGRTKLINLYGPTEATVDVSYYDCDAFESTGSVPIGKPIDNIQLFVVNEAMQCQPYGVPGELCIAGAGVARGYLNRADLTAQRFVPNPFHPGTVMYRTGDLVKWLPDGNIEYLGRMDHQVKIRGYRVECGEIESELLLHPALKEAVVIKREDRQGSPYLCAYIISSEELAVADIRRHLAKRLPEYMIPSAFVRLPELPLTASGKTDRKRLPEPDYAMATGSPYVEARNRNELMISEVWKELLGRAQISVHDNFFDIGGDSLLLIRVHQKLEQLLGSNVPITDLFSYPTIAKLAEHLDAAGQSGHSWVWGGVPVPSDYAAAQYTMNWEGSFEFRLDGMLWRQLQEVGRQEQVNPGELALAAFFLHWRQTSRQNKLELPFMNAGGHIRPLEVDFTSVLQFSDLLQTIRQSEDMNAPTFLVRQVSRAQSQSTATTLFPLLYWGPLSELKVNQELLDVFDMVLAFEPRSDNCYGRMAFHARKVNKEKLKGWVQGYVKLLHNVIEQYSRAAAAAHKESAASKQS